MMTVRDRAWPLREMMIGYFDWIVDDPAEPDEIGEAH